MGGFLYISNRRRKDIPWETHLSIWSHGPKAPWKISGLRFVSSRIVQGSYKTCSILPDWNLWLHFRHNIHQNNDFSQHKKETCWTQGQTFSPQYSWSLIKQGFNQRTTLLRSFLETFSDIFSQLIILTFGELWDFVNSIWYTVVESVILLFSMKKLESKLQNWLNRWINVKMTVTT